MKRFCLFFVGLSLFYFLDIHCLFRTIFHVSCPTCGMTRAWMAVLEGNLQQAFEYHSLFLLGPVVVWEVCWYNKYRNHKWFQRLLVITGILFFSVYMIKACVVI